LRFTSRESSSSWRGSSRDHRVSPSRVSLSPCICVLFSFSPSFARTHDCMQTRDCGEAAPANSRFRVRGVRLENPSMLGRKDGEAKRREREKEKRKSGRTIDDTRLPDLRKRERKKEEGKPDSRFPRSREGCRLPPWH